jgi:hypothetical protein
MKASVKTGTWDLPNMKQEYYPLDHMKLYDNKPVLMTFCSVNLMLRSFQCHQSKKNLRLRNVNNIYLIYNVNEGVFSSVSDADPYVIIGKLLDSIFNIRFSYISKIFKHSQDFSSISLSSLPLFIE